MANPIVFWIDHEGSGRIAILALPQGHDALPVEIRRDAGVDN
jgi:hypothetical protein